jgi:putative SOS response-associated peptidase YedK
MCGRYSLFTPPEQLEARFDVAVETYEPRYNAAPGQSLAVIPDRDDGALARMEWGLVPSWADERDGHINARGETLGERPSFRDAFEGSAGDGLAAGRCLVPADGFYEWVDEGGTSQPYRVRLTGDRPFAMAGLWSQWRPETTQTGLDAFGGGGPATGEPDIVETFAIVTTEPNDVVDDLHHRMAVVLPPEAERQWLSAAPDDARDLLEPYPDDEMEAYPVSPAVGDPANDSPALVDPLDEPT